MSFTEFDRQVKDGTITLEDGRTAKYDWSGHSFISTVPSNFPMVSTAMGVHPSQIKEHMAFLESRGCGTVHHTKDGDPILNDKGQRRKVAEALGLFDRNGGYSDPAPKYMTRCKRYR